MTTRPPGSPDTEALAGLFPAPGEGDMPSGRQQIIREHLLSEFTRPGATTTPTQRIRQNKLLAGGLAAVGIAAVVVPVAVVLSSGPSAPPAQPACAAPYLNGRAPFPDGYQTTIAHAQAAVGFPISLPHNTLADQATLSQVWVSNAARLVALEYSKGAIKILLQPWPVTSSPQKWFRHERSIMTANSATIGRVNNRPALIVVPDAGSCQPSPASVEFDRNGVEIDVISQTHGTTALTDIAQSIH